MNLKEDHIAIYSAWCNLSKVMRKFGTKRVKILNEDGYTTELDLYQVENRAQSIFWDQLGGYKQDLLSKIQEWREYSGTVSVDFKNQKIEWPNAINNSNEDSECLVHPTSNESLNYNNKFHIHTRSYRFVQLVELLEPFEKIPSMKEIKKAFDCSVCRRGNSSPCIICVIKTKDQHFIRFSRHKYLAMLESLSSIYKIGGKMLVAAEMNGSEIELQLEENEEKIDQLISMLNTINEELIRVEALFHFTRNSPIQLSFYGSKLEAAWKEIEAIKKNVSDAKLIVFSEWDDSLSILQEMIENRSKELHLSIETIQIKGSKVNEKQMTKFKESKGFSILLLPFRGEI
eukprot:TRINITY_DN3428_c0_g1_i4.p1 TRINITY_DN3428_c0_g1~~TRINITY_DN3428_c0_g1_i4.p1  ORF type:complete len:366 (+),score=87.67 TRINITY_DN3428_c0_g1_i4:68-1099(+)